MVVVGILILRSSITFICLIGAVIIMFFSLLFLVYFMELIDSLREEKNIENKPTDEAT